MVEVDLPICLAMTDKFMWVFRRAIMLYRPSWESCWYFNDVFLSVVGEEY